MTYARDRASPLVIAPGRKYSAEDDDVIRNMSVQAAAEVLGLKTSQIHGRRKRIGQRENPEIIQTRQRHRTYERISAAIAVKSEKVSPVILAERDRRLALQHTNLTAAHLGDPLPGYSALDRKRAEQLAMAPYLKSRICTYPAIVARAYNRQLRRLADD